MKNNQIIGAILIGVFLLLKVGDSFSVPNLKWPSLIKPDLPEEVDEMIPSLREKIKNKNDAITIGHTYLSSAKMFAIDSRRPKDKMFYNSEEKIKWGVLHAENASLLYRDINIGEKYPDLAEFLSEKAIEELDEEGFNHKSACDFLKKVGIALINI